MKENIIPHEHIVSVKDRRKLNKHNSFLLWFTGLSGSGKSTISNLVEQELHKLGVRTYLLDGDNVRNGINCNLTFSPEDRTENIRRVAEIGKLMIDAGLVVVAAFVSPYAEDRANIKSIVGENNFIEVFVNTSVEECERRDVKGLYKKARKGEIKNFTGISAPYEAPENANIEIRTEQEAIEVAVNRVLDYITRKLSLQDE
ncbi:adenylyl-sulfate kinase [uncultured Algibacter sp.]|uniref:adenylyl-sulfate kinase n=1 Tax=uncultured Algibacter sp. TaxID=298659 RepID=UPI00260E6544|nr:adenylyl-sulfate kinase [uncultured Algibacter sp.]